MIEGDRLRHLDEDLAFLGEDLVRDRPIGPLTTYRVGGSAARFVSVRDAATLGRIALALGERVRPGAGDVLVIGRGSNLLVSDAGIDALVLQLGEGFDQIEIGESDDATAGRVIVSAGGSVSLPVLARRSVAAGLSGLEWTVGVPGSVGGAVRMNAGGHGADVSESLIGIRRIDLATGEDVEVPASQLDLRYRSSALEPQQVVVRADFAVEARDPDGSEGDPGAAMLSEIVRWRRENQPGGQNAGSVFTNPPGDSAGRLIDAAGCKGLRIGSAEVSPKHANFIQADPGGSADDVAALMRAVIDRVATHSGVTLHPETVMVGFDR